MPVRARVRDPSADIDAYAGAYVTRSCWLGCKAGINVHVPHGIKEVRLATGHGCEFSRLECKYLRYNVLYWNYVFVVNVPCMVNNVHRHME